MKRKAKRSTTKHHYTLKTSKGQTITVRMYRYEVQRGESTYEQFKVVDRSGDKKKMVTFSTLALSSRLMSVAEKVFRFCRRLPSGGKFDWQGHGARPVRPSTRLTTQAKAHYLRPAARQWLFRLAIPS